jgi:protein TonB
MKLRRLIGLAAFCTVLAGTLQANIRITAADAMRAAVAKPAPAYSPVARQMKVAGHVEVEAVIATDGSVESAKAVTGNPLLTQSAVQAVQKWKFTPFTADGEPTKAVVTLSFDFKP